MTDERINDYLKALENEERAAATIEKYRRALLSFAAFLSGAAVTQEMIRLWKDDLREKNYAPSTINTYLAALNGFFRFCGWTDCRARFLKIQRRLFREERRELTRAEYDRLLETARSLGRRPRPRAPDGNHLLHRHSRQRGAVYHRRSGEKRQDRNCFER